MNQRLVAHIAALGFSAESLQYLGIETNSDEPPRPRPQWWAPNAPHGAELVV